MVLFQCASEGPGVCYRAVHEREPVDLSSTFAPEPIKFCSAAESVKVLEGDLLYDLVFKPTATSLGSPPQLDAG